VNFGVIYGASARKIDSTSGRAGTYQTFLDQFPNASNFMRKTINQVVQCGYVETLFGYRLYVEEQEPHKGVNAIVQGTAGDIVKNAMVCIHQKGLVDWLPGGSAIVANIHDELVLEFPESYPYHAISRRIMREMRYSGKNVGVETPVSAALIRTNWAQGKPFS